MHELSIMQGVVSIVEREAARCGSVKVLSIRLRVGQLSGIVPGCLREFFPIAAARTAAEGAPLENVPGLRLRGAAGGERVPPLRWRGVPPHCG